MNSQRETEAEGATPRRRRKRLRLAIAFVSLGVGIGLAEILLRSVCPLTYKIYSGEGVLLDWRPSQPYGTRVSTLVWEVDFAETASTEDVERWDRGTSIPDQQGTAIVRHTRLGWDCKPTLRAHKAVAWTRGRDLRILAVGDSFTFGSDVRWNESWPYQLQEALPDSEVLNAGVPGYGVDQVALKLEQLGERLKPQVVVWGLVSYDVERAGRAWFPKSWMPKPVVEFKDGEMKVQPPRTRAEVIDSTRTWWKHSRVALALIAGVDVLRYAAWKEECTSLFAELLQHSKAKVESWGGELLLVYIPTGGPILREDDQDGRGLMQTCAAAGVSFLDLRQSLRSLDLSQEALEGLTLKPGGRGHYTKRGNAYIASLVAKELGSSKPGKSRENAQEEKDN